MYRVLVVDDEPEIGRSLRRVLRGTYEVELAANATEGLAKLEVFRPDIVISDHSMPGMSGAQLLSEVHRRLPDSIRILLSGLVELDLAALPDHVGSISRFLKKPWKNDELLVVLAALIEERPGPRPEGLYNRSDSAYGRDLVRDVGTSVRDERTFLRDARGLVCSGPNVVCNARAFVLDAPTFVCDPRAFVRNGRPFVRNARTFVCNARDSVPPSDSFIAR